jgi:uncharacterized lipoprotein YddW (UPF0748 family)
LFKYAALVMLCTTNLAPWSKYLTGKQGLAPSLAILDWMITQAHDRGFEFHAWLNPYRATMDLNTVALSSHDMNYILNG